MRSMGDSLTQYIKKKKGEKSQTMETSLGGGLGVKSVSNRQGSPQPRTPNTENIKEREGC